MRLLWSGVFMFAVLVAGFVPVLASEIDAKTAHALAQAGELTIIDIRRPVEWRKTGVPEGSVGISLQNFYRKIRGQFPGDVLAAVDGDKDRSIALICASGGRSAVRPSYSDLPILDLLLDRSPTLCLAEGYHSFNPYTPRLGLKKCGSL